MADGDSSIVTVKSNQLNTDREKPTNKESSPEESFLFKEKIVLPQQPLKAGCSSTCHDEIHHDGSSDCSSVSSSKSSHSFLKQQGLMNQASSSSAIIEKTDVNIFRQTNNSCCSSNTCEINCNIAKKPQHLFICGCEQSDTSSAIDPVLDNIDTLSLSSSSTQSNKKSSNYKILTKLKRKTCESTLQTKHVCWQCSSCASPSSSLSLSASFSDEEYFEDAELPGATEDFKLFYRDSRDKLFIDDWDSGQSSNSNSNNSHEHQEDDEWTDANSLFENEVNYEEMRQRRSQEAPPMYPHRALLYMECSVCFTKSYLRRRVCCDFQICHECMGIYVSMKVNEAKVQIECPNDRCHVLVHRDEVNERLPNDLKDKFTKFLIDANADPCEKTCPACSKVYTIKPESLSSKKKLKNGLKVYCPQCHLQWCFLCQAPFHTGVSCKQYWKGDKMVKRWAKERSYGQSNAQKCPKCGIYIQKVHGCDHMKCSKCHTDFCYRCGDRYISVKLLGNHWSRFSLFGCKYRLMPERPGLRRLIRGTNFAARLVAGVVLAGLGLAAGAVLVGASVVIVPGYGIFLLKRHLWRKKQRKKFEKQKMKMIALAEVDRKKQGLTLNSRQTSVAFDDSEIENQDDAQQVKAIVHRSLSFNREESLAIKSDIFINKYISDGTEVTITRPKDSNFDDVVVVSDVLEIPNENGYSTVVANVVSKMHHSTEKETSVVRQGSNVDQGVVKQDENKDVSTNLEKIEAPVTDSVEDVNPLDASLEQSSSDFDENQNLPSENEINPDGNKNSELDVKKTVDVKSDKSAEDSDSLKGDRNGCFGNIFSKRIPTTSEELMTKTIISNSHKKFVSCKAATWEKCNRDKMLKSTPSDQKGDASKLSLFMQKTPASLASVLNAGGDFSNQMLHLSSKNVTKLSLESAVGQDVESMFTHGQLYKAGDPSLTNGDVGSSFVDHTVADHTTQSLSPDVSTTTPGVTSPSTLDLPPHQPLDEPAQFEPVVTDDGYVSPYTLIAYV
ncbi:uncharacterized protein LOC131928071 [Physella acuta]|uniref:uncharacterized protein LOC131928071 n=1 Tax=Physella acuta TaxID=109671 RepID=UPI0027DE8A74|nr:uncharacterized protein LOC131928071 [Physella acuta]